MYFERQIPTKPSLQKMTLTGRSFKILNVCMVLENHEPVHEKHEHYILYPDAITRAYALNLGFDNTDNKSGCYDTNLSQKISDYLQILKRGKK